MRAVLYILAISLFGHISAQNVPNGGFENWSTEDFFVLQDWISYGKPERVSSEISGNYAMKLSNSLSSDGNYYASSIYNVDWTNGTIDKFPYDGDPLSVVFYAKYNFTEGDSAIINTAFYEDSQFRGYNEVKITGSSNGEFVKFSVPIIWYASHTPDSVYIGMKSLSSGDIAHGPGFITIDDFHFENIGERTVDILNHDFENWTNEGVVYPTQWMPIDLLAFRYWGGFLRNPSVWRSSESFRGEYALAIHNFTSWEDNGEGFCATGSTSDQAWRPAFALDQKYKYLQGYYKLEQGDNDTAEIAFNIFGAQNYVGEGRFRTSTPTNTWTYFSIPVNYYSEISPDSATIRLVSSINTTNNSQNTTLFIDDLSFVMETDNRVSISSPLTIPFRVFPNPFKDNLTVAGNSIKYNLSNLMGTVMCSSVDFHPKHIIETSTLAAGVYLLTIIDNNQKQWQQMIIKQ